MFELPGIHGCDQHSVARAHPLDGPAVRARPVPALAGKPTVGTAASAQGRRAGILHAQVDVMAPQLSYRDRVPAVARAVHALEHLASSQHPLSLTALSKAIDVGPSSLLAILTTLRNLGLVSRSPKDGHYLPGPGLVALGTAAAQRLEPLHTFDLLASDLVESLGETVLLWIQQGDGLAMAACAKARSHCATCRPWACACRRVAGRPRPATASPRASSSRASGCWPRHSTSARCWRSSVRRCACAAPRATERAPRCAAWSAGDGRRVGRRGPDRAARARRLSVPGAGREPVVPVGRRLSGQRAALVRLGWAGVLAGAVAGRRVGRARATQPARVAVDQRIDAAAAPRSGARADAAGRRSGREPVAQRRGPPGGALCATRPVATARRPIRPVAHACCGWCPSS